MPIDPALAARLHRQAGAARWRVPLATFTSALETSSNKAFSGGNPGSGELTRYLTSLHLEDLALACACAMGDNDAWDHFVMEMRPALYRAADALDRSGSAREAADSLYAELYGVEERDGVRRSLLRYFHGRSSLSTWLRAVLAQRFVDRVRTGRRLEPLPDDMSIPAAESAPDPECGRFVQMLRAALERVLGGLETKDRLRFGCYYAQQLTLAQTGRLLKEHEATVSRQLARTRKRVRGEVERELRAAGLGDVQIARCFECAVEDAGSLDVADLLKPVRKTFLVNRSI